MFQMPFTIFITQRDKDNLQIFPLKFWGMLTNKAGELLDFDENL